MSHLLENVLCRNLTKKVNVYILQKIVKVTPSWQLFLSTPYKKQSLSTPYRKQSISTPYKTQKVSTPYSQQSMSHLTENSLCLHFTGYCIYLYIHKAVYVYSLQKIVRSTPYRKQYLSMSCTEKSLCLYFATLKKGMCLIKAKRCPLQ